MTEQKHILLIGMNHNTASVEIREKFSLAPFCPPEAEAFKLHFSDICTEVFILSTCNRVELLAMMKPEYDKDDLIARWASLKNGSVEELSAHIFAFADKHAVTHLFSVASSLDSLVLGEPQILGQLKQSYKQCLETKSVRSIFTRLLHKAFFVAKRVRTETSLASSAVSISYAAVELAKRIFNSIEEHKALIIGAGEMAELAALHLKQTGIQEMYVANRTFANAQELANKIGGEAISFDAIEEYLVHVDIIISSTGASHAILSAKDIKPILKARKYKPMFFIDIAMPRDIDPDVNTLDNVYLYDIDDLKEVVEENKASRRSEAEKARAIVLEEAENFNHWLDSLQCQPTVIALNERTEALIRKELERSLKKLQNVDEDTKQELELMVQSLVKKINHKPLEYLKKHHDMDKSVINIKKIFDI